ncbi:MAG: hypothetical protein AAFQ82_22150, partial [Myxococcota bacterium]
TSVESFDTERRYFTAVPFELGLLDLNASFEDPEDVTLELEYIIDEGATLPSGPVTAEEPRWWEGTLLYDAPWQVDEPTIQVGQVLWSALNDADDDVPELVSARVDAVGDGTLSSIVSFVPKMRLRIRAVDETGERSPWVTTPPFSLGNETPEVEIVSFPDVPMSGLVPIELELSDSSSDPVTIELQFRRGEDDPWRAAHIVQGGTQDVLTAPTPNRYVLVWDSSESLDDDLSVPQGIGSSSRDDVEIRIRATDNPAAGVVHHSLWGPSQALPPIDNQ